MLRLFFEDVELFGLEGDDAIKADFAQRRRSGERILRLDRFDLRKKIPRRAYVWSYTRALPVVYRLLGSAVNGVGSGLDASHFSVTDHITEATPGLFAIARSPRPSVTPSPRREPAGGAAE
jgi:hypothetical protein